MNAWRRSGLYEQLDRKHIFDTKSDALATVVPILDPAVCARCTKRIFLECAAMPAPPGAPEKA